MTAKQEFLIVLACVNVYFSRISKCILCGDQKCFCYHVLLLVFVYVMFLSTDLYVFVALFWPYYRLRGFPGSFPFVHFSDTPEIVGSLVIGVVSGILLLVVMFVAVMWRRIKHCPSRYPGQY